MALPYIEILTGNFCKGPIKVLSSKSGVSGKIFSKTLYTKQATPGKHTEIKK